MIDFTKPPSGDDAGGPQDGSGNGGNPNRDEESGLTKRALARLTGRAVRQRWKLSRRNRREVAERMCDIAKAKTEKAAVSVLAGSVVVRMEGQNQSDEHHAEGETVKHLHALSGSADAIAAAAALRLEMMNDPRYLSAIREADIVQDGNPGELRGNGERGALEDGETPSPN